jgi:bifunctional DNase/RNase
MSVSQKPVVVLGGSGGTGVNVRGMLSAEIWSVAQTSQGNVVLLRPRDLGIAVPIFIGQLETQAILIGREGVVLPRPLTHDLLLTLLQSMGLTLERVEVYDLKKNTFHARLIVTGKEFGEKAPLILDSRPSDAFALAVRRHCPILIDSGVVEQAGIPLDFFIDQMDETEELIIPDAKSEEPLSPAEAKYRQLLEQLNQAVAAEEYERAAELRDTLIRLDKEREGGEIQGGAR